MKNLIWLILIIGFISCGGEELFSDQARHDYWLLHNGADLPVIVEGNTNSKVFLILLHGGPGGSAQEFNASTKTFTDALEEDLAMVYYDQRNSGHARGEWEEEKLTIEQHVEDLDKVIDLIHHKYGADIKIFLAGHSWGGFLGTAYILEASRAARVEAWININGSIHRQLRNRHNLERIITIADQQLAANTNIENWTSIKTEVQSELDKNLIYDAETERVPNGLKSRAEVYINQDGLTINKANPVTESIYQDNYDPFLILVNDRKGTLIQQLYDFDQKLELELLLVDLPVLSIYGKYDVTTAPQQGQYLIDQIATPDADKKFVLLNQSGHSTMNNEPTLLAEEIKGFLEKYK